MRLLILGASGFIGSHLATRAVAAGHEVIALCRKGRVPGFNGRVEQWSLGDCIPVSFLRTMDCAVHLAHDFTGRRGAERTISGTMYAAELITEAGVGKQIFFSSYNSGPNAVSLYGRTKTLLERQLSRCPGLIVVRPGLVLGHGGIYGRIARFVEKFPLVPLPDGGRDLLHVIKAERLCEEVLTLAANPEAPRECNMFEKEPIRLRQLVLDAAAERGRKPTIVNIPSGVVKAALQFGGFLHLPLPVTAENLEGLLSSGQMSHISDLS
jgi:nucleoside-diphosphate-sugar epimerase